METAGGAARQVPQYPRVDRAEQRVPCVSLGARARHVVEQPSQLEAAEVRRERQPSAGAKSVLAAVPRVRGDEVRCTRVLPDERVRERRACVAVPEHRRLALVRDADGRELIGPYAAARKRLADYDLRVTPNFGRVVLDPARLRIDLLVLALRNADDRTQLVEHDEAAARGALVDCADVFAHDWHTSRHE